MKRTEMDGGSHRGALAIWKNHRSLLNSWAFLTSFPAIFDNYSGRTTTFCHEDTKETKARSFYRIFPFVSSQNFESSWLLRPEVEYVSSSSFRQKVTHV